jgi:mxaA protein
MKNLIKNIFAPIFSLLSLSLIGLASSATVSFAVESAQGKLLSITNPSKNNGVLIGDVLSRNLVLEAQSPYHLSKTTLPKLGNKVNGIELVNFQVKEEKQNKSLRYSITLNYQVFATAEVPTVMSLPVEKFTLTDGANTYVLNTPAWPFWFAPLVAGGVTVADKNIQPQLSTPLVDVHSHQTRLYASLGLLLASALALIYINADRQWMPFMGGPFAQAHRKLKYLAKGNASPENLKKAFVTMHQAFNRTFGVNLFASDIDTLVTSRANFSKTQSEIRQFFNDSNQSLYTRNTQDNSKAIQSLVELSKQLRDCERRV